MENREEKLQAIALEAIKAITGAKDPVKYASFNYNVYEVALKAAELSMKKFEM